MRATRRAPGPHAGGQRGGVGAQMVGEPLEYPPGSQPISRLDVGEGRRDGGFDRAAAPGIGAGAPRCEPQSGAPPVCRIGDSHQQALRDQTLHHTGEGARMHVKDGGEIAGRQAGKEADDAEDQPLRAGDPEIGGHRFRAALEAMHDRPEQLHEIEYVRKLHLLTCVHHRLITSRPPATCYGFIVYRGGMLDTRWCRRYFELQLFARRATVKSGDATTACPPTDQEADMPVSSLFLMGATAIILLGTFNGLLAQTLPVRLLTDTPPLALARLQYLFLGVGFSCSERWDTRAKRLPDTVMSRCPKSGSG